MIVKSRLTLGANIRQLRHHLLRADTNEHVELGSSRDVLSRTLTGSLAEFEAIAALGRSKYGVIHASINPDEPMTDAQWDMSWRIFERVQGLQKQPYHEVQHVKDGRHHRHRVYLAIDPVTGKGIPFKKNFAKNETVARICEVELGHQVTPGRFNRAVIKAIETMADTEKEPARQGRLTAITSQLRAAGIDRVERPEALLTSQERYAVDRRGVDPKASWKGALRAYQQGGQLEHLMAQGLFPYRDGAKVMVVDAAGERHDLTRAIRKGAKLEGTELRIKQAEIAARLPSMANAGDDSVAGWPARYAAWQERRQQAAQQGLAHAKPPPVEPSKPTPVVPADPRVIIDAQARRLLGDNHDEAVRRYSRAARDLIAAGRVDELVARFQDNRSTWVSTTDRAVKRSLDAEIYELARALDGAPGLPAAMQKRVAQQLERAAREKTDRDRSGGIDRD